MTVINTSSGRAAWAALAALALVGCGRAGTAGAPDQPADLIILGGPVVTVNDAQPTAEAVAVRDGKILAVGTRAQVERLKGPATRVQDLGGKTLLPGFIDGHGHVSGVGFQAVAANLLPPPDGRNDSIPALQQTMREWMAASPLPKKYGLIFGFGYDDSQLKEGRHPTRDELDAISTELPVYFVHQSGHLGVANSKALELAGITASTPNPPGGIIRRRAGSQEPDGVLEENAHYGLLGKVIFGKVGSEESAALIRAGQDLYLKFGYTTGQDGATDPGNVAGFIAAAEAGKLDMDVVSYPSMLTLGDGAFMRGPYQGRAYRNHFRIGGVKIVLDGSPQGKTAWLSKPYFKPPAGQPADYAGYPAMQDPQVNALIEEAYRNNWQVLVHTNGDAAIDQLIRAVEHGAKAVPGSDRRTVSIHAQTARIDQIDAMKRLGIFPSFFPMHTFYWGDWHRDSVLGPERAANISPTGWALQRGMMFTSHHDAPVAFPDSMRVLSATVNRTTRSGQILGPEQRVDPIVGLKAMTLWAAYQHFEEQTKGSIEPGKLADFVVLSDNPLTVERARLSELAVLETIKEGRSVYRRAGVTAAAVGCGDSPKCFERLAAVVAAAPPGTSGVHRD